MRLLFQLLERIVDLRVRFAGWRANALTTLLFYAVVTITITHVTSSSGMAIMINTQNIYSIVFIIVSAIKFLIIEVLLFALNIIHVVGVESIVGRCEPMMTRESSTEPRPHLHFGCNC